MGLSKEKICRSIRKVSGYPPIGSTPSRHMSPQRHPMRFTQEAMKQVGRRGARPRAPLVVLADDMVRAGLVETLAHPGGNVTPPGPLAPSFPPLSRRISRERGGGRKALAGDADDFEVAEARGASLPATPPRIPVLRLAPRREGFGGSCSAEDRREPGKAEGRVVIRISDAP